MIANEQTKRYMAKFLKQMFEEDMTRIEIYDKLANAFDLVEDPETGWVMTEKQYHNKYRNDR